MYIKKNESQIQTVNNTNNETNAEDLLEKFYEERQSFFEEQISNKSFSRANEKLSVDKKKYQNKPLNFDSLTNHKNVEPNKVFSYADYKFGTIDPNPLNTKENKEINSKNTDLNAPCNIKYNSFRDKVSTKQKTDNKRNHQIKNERASNKKNTIEGTKENNKVITLFPRKLTNTFKPTLLINNDNKKQYPKSINQNMLSQNGINPKELKDIYEKRKNYFSENKGKKVKRCNTIGSELYERNKNYMQKTKEKVQILKEQIEKTEMDNCSFAPKITETTNQILNDSISYKSYMSVDDFYQKNIEWKAQKNNLLKEKINYLDKKKYEECSFQPNHNDQSKYVKEITGRSGDYIYKKNIEWLNKVKENRKRNELELLEEYNQEIEKVKEQNAKLIKYANKEKSILSHEENLELLARPKYINNKIKRSRSFSTRSMDKSNGFSIQSQMNTYDISEMKSLIESLKDTIEKNKNMKENFE